MTTISDAVDTVKTTGIKLAGVRKELTAAHDVLKVVEMKEKDARKRYAVALGELEKLTGGYT